MCHHIGLREFAGRLEAVAHFIEKRQVDVNLLIAGAVKRPHRRLRVATRAHCIQKRSNNTNAKKPNIAWMINVSASKSILKN